MKRQRIAIVGGGTAGATLAWHLAALHQVTLFEAGEQLGDHAFTHTLLGAYEYVPVEAILHSDSAAVAHGSPDSYCVFVEAADAPAEANHAWGTLTRVVTHFEPSSTLLYVTFDPKMALDPAKVILRKQWKLPKLRPLDLHRRSLIRAIQGRERIWYCGTMAQSERCDYLALSQRFLDGRYLRTYGE